jgi:hypothetical protein
MNIGGDASSLAFDTTIQVSEGDTIDFVIAQADDQSQVGHVALDTTLAVVQ